MAKRAQLHIKTISEYHRLLGQPSPEHPLVSLIRFEDMPYDPERMPTAIVHNFYSIALKKHFMPGSNTASRKLILMKA